MRKIFVVVLLTSLLLVGCGGSSLAPSQSAPAGNPVIPATKAIVVWPSKILANSHMVAAFDIPGPGTYKVVLLVSPVSVQADMTLRGVTSAPGSGADRSFNFTATEAGSYVLDFKTYNEDMGLTGGIYPD